MRRLTIGGALVAVATLLGACGSGTEVKAGTVSFTLNGPVPARAVMFRIAGAHSAVSLPTGQPFRVFSQAGNGDTVTVAVIANQGAVLAGAVIEVGVPDLSVKPTVTVLQVTGTDYSLKSAASFSLSALAP
jgi:hypothetical protein